MSYSIDLRERVVNYVRGGGGPSAAAHLFQVGRATIYRWLDAPDLMPRPAKERKRKLDKVALAAHVRDFLDELLRERATHCGVTVNAIWVALKKLAITKKTTRYSESRCEERITFLRQLRTWVAEHSWKNVVYFDESGFQAAFHRPHGWAPRGNKVFGRIAGNNHERTNLIMAKRGKDWIAPMLFETNCTHLTVKTWIKKMLLPTLWPQSLVVMDNAPFHNKPKIAEILSEHGHRLLPLPRYSPDFNPIEKAFAILKRQRIFSGKSVDELIASHS